MKETLALLRIEIRLALRKRAVLVFHYLLPIASFLIACEMAHAERGGTASLVVSMVLVFGILASGFFGGGMRAVQDRENGILRRFKVAPIGPLPLLLASLGTGVALFLPAAVVVIALGCVVYGMPVPERLPSLCALVVLGVLAFRALGLVVASVVGSVQESQIVMQLVYLPMLLLSGAAIPLSMLPVWAQRAGQFLPSSYLITGIQGIFLRREGLLENAAPAGALAVTAALGTFLAAQFFRWDRGERIRPAGKLWAALALAPFVALGAWQIADEGQLRKARALAREARRGEATLIRDARIVTGDGAVIERGAVLVKGGVIAEVFEGAAPASASERAVVIEAAGKTLLPGFVDARGSLGGELDGEGGVAAALLARGQQGMTAALAGYLYSGITSVRSAGDPLDEALRARAMVASGEELGAGLVTCGPLLIAMRGEIDRARLTRARLFAPASEEEARQAVRDLKRAGVDGVALALDTAPEGARVDPAIERAIIGEAHAQGLRASVRAGDARDVADAINAGADLIERVASRDRVPEDLFARMARAGVAYLPVLASIEAHAALAAGSEEPLARSLVQQVEPPDRIEAMRAAMRSGRHDEVVAADRSHALELAKEDLARASRAGVQLVAGSGSGGPLLVPGPALHRELWLWVQAGVHARVAIEAATGGAARALGVEGRVGRIREGLDADLLLIDGDPLDRIEATERITMVMAKGERVDRSDLLADVR